MAWSLSLQYNKKSPIFREYLEKKKEIWYNKFKFYILNRWRINMAVSYKKLWKLLIDKDMKKEDLRKATGITTTAMAKLGRNENVNTEILAKICKVLDCNIGDIMDFIDVDK